jgi:Amt family ammonium transporter
MALNGSLAGLVGITAGANVVSVNGAMLIGLIAGILVVFSVFTFDKLKLDDPVGALSVHLVCGIWGTLAVGFFATGDALAGMEKTRAALIGVQAQGVLYYGVFCVVCAAILFGILKATIGIRVSEEEEIGGLDIGEHGMEAYGGFQIWTTQ